MSIKSKIAELEKVKIHYQYAGEGEPIIFLHGFPEFSYEWRKQLEHFSKTHLAIAPDLRGYNLSSKPEGVDQYTVAALAQDVRDLCDHLHLKKIVLVGHDWGGIVAWAFAYLYPEYLDKLVILNAPHPAIYNHQIRTNPTQQKAAEYILLLRRATAAKILSRNNFEWLSGWVLNKGLAQGTLTEADKQAYVNAWSQPGALEAMLNYYRALNLDMNEDKTPDWSSFALAPEYALKQPHLTA